MSVFFHKGGKRRSTDNISTKYSAVLDAIHDRYIAQQSSLHTQQQRIDTDIDHYFSTAHKYGLNSIQPLSPSHKLSKTERIELSRIIPIQSETKKHMLMSDMSSTFNRWNDILRCTTNNLLVVGLGSKTYLIDAFIAKHLTDANIVICSGRNTDVDILTIYNTVATALSTQEQHFDNVLGCYSFLKSVINDTTLQINAKPQIVVVINNLDGVAFRAPATIYWLSQLSRLNGIKLVCSVDHILADLMFKQHEIVLFSFIITEATTYADYVPEYLYAQ